MRTTASPPIDIDKKDDAYAPKTYGSLMGIRMPDAIAAFQAEGKTYLVTANEGMPGSGGTRIWAPFTSMRTSGTSVTRA